MISRSLHTAGVRGSKPFAPTKISLQINRLLDLSNSDPGYCTKSVLNPLRARGTGCGSNGEQSWRASYADCRSERTRLYLVMGASSVLFSCARPHRTPTPQFGWMGPTGHLHTILDGQRPLFLIRVCDNGTGCGWILSCAALHLHSRQYR